MSLDKLKDISLFEGKSLDEIFNVIFKQSLEEREEAMATFKRFREMVGDSEDLFMSGDKPHPYLDSAHKATENLIKMISASHKLLDLETESKDSVNANDILDLLDREGIAPKRFIPESDDEEQNDTKENGHQKGDQSVVEFPQLNKKV
jgi:hypothetical protein